MFNYRPHTLPQQFFVIGGGGTGGRLVPLLAQFLRSITKDTNPRGWLVNPQIVVIDFDVVEEKNLIRQNFIAQDVGKHKATVLANRYSRAFGVNIVPMLERIDHNMYQGGLERSLKTLMGADFIGSRDAMVLMCVDSVAARKEVLRAFADMNATVGSQPYFVIDAGNEDTFGQVKFFHLKSIVTHFSRTTSEISSMEAPKMTPVPVSLPFIPMDLNYYNNIVDNQAVSCAELDQTLAINASMATMMMGVVQNYMYCKPFSYNGRNIDLNGAGSTTFMDLNAIKRAIWYQKEIDSLPEGSLLKLFPRDRMVAAAKPLVKRYIRENSDKLLSMGIDPATGKALEKVEVISMIEDPAPPPAPPAEPTEPELMAVPMTESEAAALGQAMRNAAVEAEVGIVASGEDAADAIVAADRAGEAPAAVDVDFDL